MPPYKGYHYDASITYSPPFGPQQSGSNYSHPLPSAVLQGEILSTCIVTITPDFSAPLTLQGTPCNSPKTQYEGQEASLDVLQLPQMRREPAPASLSQGPASSGQSSTARGALKKSYSCERCDKEFTQLQGLNRHRREIHEPKMCTFCGVFKWGRRYLLKEHLKKKHPELAQLNIIDRVLAIRPSKRRSQKSGMSRWEH